MDMKLSDETLYLRDRLGEEQAIRLLAETGFDCVDFTMDGLHYDDHILNSPGAEAHMRKIRALGDDLGITFNQAHAPWVFEWERPGVIENVCVPRTIRALELAGILGVDTVIVHPLHFMKYRYENYQKIWDMNMEFYRKLLPHAKANNVRICLENLFQFDSRNVAMPDTCAEPDKFVQAIDVFNDPHIVGCLDVGHAVLIGDSPARYIYALGHDRLKALHIHDNSAIVDTHTLPYLGGKVDWNETTKALADIDYDGVFTFESFLFYKNFEDDFLPQAARFVHDMGRYLIAKIEKYKAEKA